MLRFAVRVYSFACLRDMALQMFLALALVGNPSAHATPDACGKVALGELCSLCGA